MLGCRPGRGRRPLCERVSSISAWCGVRGDRRVRCEQDQDSRRPLRATYEAGDREPHLRPARGGRRVPRASRSMARATCGRRCSPRGDTGEGCRGGSRSLVDVGDARRLLTRHTRDADRRDEQGGRPFRQEIYGSLTLSPGFGPGGNPSASSTPWCVRRSSSNAAASNCCPSIAWDSGRGAATGLAR